MTEIPKVRVQGAGSPDLGDGGASEIGNRLGAVRTRGTISGWIRVGPSVVHLSCGSPRTRAVL